jgi:hypothetical protein
VRKLDEVGEEDDIRDLKVKGSLILEYGVVKRRQAPMKGSVGIYSPRARTVIKFAGNSPLIFKQKHSSTAPNASQP